MRLRSCGPLLVRSSGMLFLRERQRGGELVSSRCFCTGRSPWPHSAGRFRLIATTFSFRFAILSMCERIILKATRIWACADLPSGYTGGAALHRSRLSTAAQISFITPRAEHLHEWGSCPRSSRVSVGELHPSLGRGSRAPTRSSSDYAMRAFRLVMIAAVLACATSAIAGHDIAPGGTLRAAY